MLSDEKRAALLARIGPVLTVSMTEATGQRWVFVPQAAADFAVLARSADAMQIGMTPGWFEAAPRFEFAPHIRCNGTLHTLASLGVPAAGAPSLRIHVTVTRGVEAVAAELLRRVVQPYERLFHDVKARGAGAAREAQRQAADTIATLTGATQEPQGENIALWPDVGGTSLPLRVCPGGAIELGRTRVTPQQVSAIVAGLRRAGRMRPGQRAV